MTVINRARLGSDPSGTLGKVVDALTNGLTVRDNWMAKIIGPMTTDPVADTEFSVAHGLGVVPTFYLPNLDKPGVIYDSRRADWTNYVMFLKCSAASATLYLIVM